ncbi:probable chitinase 2 [Ceratina calcarata]|uniref:Probable chitinase 2 n=1 Tax=Ceratina calcarata TaxID=156304 RepID=A0AAJ7S6I1_9HYME|nr:probable chitinase 2 [Ceratina calcarata]
MKVCGSLILLAILLLSVGGTSTSARSKHKKVVTCYVATWAVYRPNNGKFTIDNIRPELCTHLVYAFAGLNETTWTIRSLDPGMDIENGIGNYRKMTQLRKRYPHLNVLLAIGGWNEGSKNYSVLVSSPERRSSFIHSVVNFLGEYGFNGFDLDWEYPGSRGGVPEDKQNFVSLVQELKEAFRRPNYLLTAAISSNRQTIDAAYDLPELCKYLDLVHVMAYDYHGTWDNKVLPNAPLKSDDGSSVMDTLSYLLSKGAPPNKTVLGLPMYGRTYVLSKKLNSSRETPIGQPAGTDGFKGPYTAQNGFMGYNEICEELVNNPSKWRTGWDEISETAYAVNDDKVIVYDDPKSLRAKVERAISLNLSGVMIWSIDTDDFSGKCASLSDSLDSAHGTFPLMRSINEVLGNSMSNHDKGESSTRKPNSSASSVASFFCYFLLSTVLFSVHYARTGI